MKKGEVIIEVAGVGKEFRMPHEKLTSLKQNAIHLFSKPSYSILKAVNDVSFNVKKGEFFGIVGRNGSGKSTLLKMLAGVYVPSKGSLKVRGTLSPFIELGVGFNPELTARENVFLNGAILGLSRQQLRERFDSIIEFAELEDFVDQKLKNFSSGMQVRLAFSIAIQAKADILLIDEVLAVGDSAFQQKCFDTFERFKQEGRTIVFVTHDMGHVTRFCDRVLIIDHGNELGVVSPQYAEKVYKDLNEKKPEAVEIIESQNRWGNGKVRVESVEFLSDVKKKSTASIRTGELFSIKLKLTRDSEPNLPLLIGFAIFRRDGTKVTGPNSGGVFISSSQQSMTYSIDKLPLTEGDYDLTVAVLNAKNEDQYDVLDKAYGFSVSGLSREYGLVDMPGTWK